MLGADLSLVHWVQRREDDLQGQNLVTAPHLRLPELEEGRLLVNLMGDVVEATDRAGLLDIELLDLDEGLALGGLLFRGEMMRGEGGQGKNCHVSLQEMPHSPFP